MGVRLRCLLKQNISGIPRMEGKALAAAYSFGGDAAGDSSSEDVIAIDFKTGQRKAQPVSRPVSDATLLTALAPFVAGDHGIQWHDAARGLAAVRGILEKLQKGAKVTVARGYGFGGDNEELTEGVRDDLKTLERILVLAQKADTEFCLAFDY